MEHPQGSRLDALGGLDPFPGDPARLLGLAKEARDGGRFGEAEQHARAAVAVAAHEAEPHRVLATILWAEDQPDGAVDAFRHALRLDPENVKSLTQLSGVLAEQGRLEEARASARRAVEVSPNSVVAWCTLARLTTFAAGSPELETLERLAAAPRTPDETIALDFALAKAYEDVGDHPHAFEWLKRANDAKRRLLDYDVDQAVGFFARVEHAFDERLVQRFTGAGCPSDIPVFVVGMPRSGTTLVEQILASHPAVHGAGELMEMQELSLSVPLLGARGTPYPEGIAELRPDDMRALGSGYVARTQRRAPEAARIVDKHPLNFRYVGLIRLMLPNARIVHCVRNPADVCASLYATLFTDLPFSYDLVELGRYYCAYARLMSHWERLFPGSIYEARYEDFVEDLQGSARRLVERCGLPWDDRCLLFHETSRSVKTASFAQVRRPIYRSSIGRWRRYERQLAPLLAELRRCGEDHVSE